MTAIAAAVMAGAAAGLSIAMPLGPTSFYLIERTLADGARAGMATGLGVATVHVAYSSVALALGLVTYGGAHGAALMTVLSGLVLACFAFRVWKRQLLPTGVRSLQSGLKRAYLDAVTFGLLNPLTPALCAAAVTAVAGAVQPGGPVIVGVFVGSLIWWSGLALAVSAMRQTISPRVLRFANRAAGILLAFLAMSMLFRGAQGLATGVL